MNGDDVLRESLGSDEEKVHRDNIIPNQEGGAVEHTRTKRLRPVTNMHGSLGDQ